MTDPNAKKGVRTLHPDYEAMAPRWKRCRDLASGEHAVHAAGESYLPKLAEELPRDYQARLQRTPLFNAFWRTITGLRGMLFRKTAEVEGVEYTDDIDMAGTPLASFVQKVVEDALTVGRVGVLVDYPQAPDTGGQALTVAQAASLGLRPSLQIYPAESIVNWKMQRIGNAVVLSLVVLTEDAPLAGDEFGHECEMRYRALDLDPASGAYRQRVYRIDDKGNQEQVGADVFPLMNGAPMREIPFVFVGVDETGSCVDEPPLIDLADMNLHHYAVSADYEHACHFQGLPTLFISGYSPQVAEPGQPVKTIYIGGPSANCLPDPQAKAYFVQVEGDFAALRANLEDKKAAMAVLGARMLEAQKRAAEAADTVAQHRKGEESLLAAMGQTVSLGMTRALGWFMTWAGRDAGAVRYELSSEFGPVGLSAQELTAMCGAWQAGMPGYSDQNVFAQLQERGMIDAETTFEEEQSRVADRGPRLVAPVA